MSETSSRASVEERIKLPAFSTFISEDPIGWTSGQTNNYAYVGGDPINFADPLGLESNQNTEDILAGFGDALTLNLTAGLRRIFRVNGVNTNSGWYIAGGGRWSNCGPTSAYSHSREACYDGDR
jgi:uncharacterized protein RhaS with RHS repeats